MKSSSIFLAILSFTLNVFSQTTIQLGGSGNFNSTDVPVCNLGNFSYTQQIYTAGEIQAASLPQGVNTITSIQFEYRGAAAGGENFNNWTVFMGETSNTEFSGINDWMPVNQMDEVFSGIVPIPTSSGNWFEITLDTPFEWDETSNIVIAIDENAPGHNSPAGFRVYNSSNSSLRSFNFSSINPNNAPTTYPNRTRFNNKPIIKLTFDGGGQNGDPGNGEPEEPSPNDSLIVGELTVQGKAQFNGLAQFDSIVRFNGLESIDSISLAGSLLYLDENNNLQKLNRDEITEFIYVLPNFAQCLPGYKPIWSNSEGKLFTAHLDQENCQANVGIGTSDPLAKLHLVATSTDEEKKVFLVEQRNSATDFRPVFQVTNDGLVRAREVLVDQDAWPDYVFDENYELMPLADVKRYIQQNGHLPNVPKASEVEANGVSLGETAKITMEKVEELMLYILQQQEEIEDQKETVKEQRKLIEEQRALIEQQKKALEELMLKISK